MEAQGTAIRRHPEFPRLAGFLRDSAALRRLRLERIAYALLDEPRLEPRNLANFYDTYRVPKSPFFPLFLSIKWDQREKKAAAREERAKYISAVAATYPRDMLGLMRYLAEAERSRNPMTPVFMKSLYPATKKRARELAAFTMAEWLPFIAGYVEALRNGYRRLDLIDTESLIACALLECLPDPTTGRLPTRAAIKAQFRKLSMAYHPDRGGDASRFLLVKKSSDLLSSRYRQRG